MELTDILGKYYPVLDHGFVSLKGVFGGDQDIEEFARVSYQKGTRKTSDSRGLLRYLMAHRHSSPFESVEFKFHLRMPIFVARQWIRHRTANVNEASARYSEMKDIYYVPELAQIQKQSTTNKQGREEGLSAEEKVLSQNLMVESASDSFQEYRMLLNRGIARETARIVAPLSAYTEMYWKIDLHNLFHFLSLRCDPHAQWEIRQFANVMARMVQIACPLAYEAWLDYQYAAVSFSRMEMDLLRKYVFASDISEMGEVADLYGDFYHSLSVNDGLTKREIVEFVKKLSTEREPIPELNLSLFRSAEDQESIDTNL